jgi:hypothetical protein
MMGINPPFYVSALNKSLFQFVENRARTKRFHYSHSIDALFVPVVTHDQPRQTKQRNRKIGYVIRHQCPRVEMRGEYVLVGIKQNRPLACSLGTLERIINQVTFLGICSLCAVVKRLVSG